MKGLNGHLVVVRHLMDDIPIMLCDDREVAVKFASMVKGDDPAFTMPAYWDTDASTPTNVAVVDFVDGFPSRIEVIRIFNEETEVVQG